MDLSLGISSPWTPCMRELKLRRVAKAIVLLIILQIVEEKNGFITAVFVSKWILDSKNKKKSIDGSQQLDFFLIVAVCEEKDGTVIKLCVMVPDSI
jgi:hypothetical protein